MAQMASTSGEERERALESGEIARVMCTHRIRWENLSLRSISRYDLCVSGSPNSTSVLVASMRV